MKDQTQVEKLMVKRVKVVGYYPHSLYNIGDILTRVSTEEFGGAFDFYQHRNMETTYANEVDKSPTIFQPMPWYEGRSVEEMPDYVKVIRDSINHSENNFGKIMKCGVDVFWNSNDFTSRNGKVVAYGGIMIECFTPATEQEYLTFINKKQLE